MRRIKYHLQNLFSLSHENEKKKQNDDCRECISIEEAIRRYEEAVQY